MVDALLECPACGLRAPQGAATCPRDGSRLRLCPDPSATETAPRDLLTVMDTAPRSLVTDPLGPLDTAPRTIVSLPGELGPEGPTLPAGRLPALTLTGPTVPAWVRRPQQEVTPDSPTLHQDMLVGARLGEYVVVERIGEGGMGLVYRGEQPVIRKSVAIKVLRPEVCDNPEYVQRLLAEARAVNAIHHRGIIDVFSFGQTPDGRQYFVMEFLEGTTLDKHIASRGALPPREAIALFEEILAALAAAHEAGVVHRDLKPSNIFLVRQPGGAPYVKLLDFGLAKQEVTDLPTALTQAGRIIGTPEYMAPEQARSQPSTPKTDLYSFGVMAFEMLTGRLPFHAETPVAYLVKQLQEPPPPLLGLRPGLPPALATLVTRLMAKRAEDRPAMAEVRQELRRLARAPLLEPARAPSLPPAPLSAPLSEGRRETMEQPAAPLPPRPLPLAEAHPRQRALPRGAVAVAAGLAGVGLVALGAAVALRASSPAGPAPTITSRRLSGESAALLSRIDRLERALGASSRSGQEREAALDQLRQARGRAEGASSAEQRRAVSESLDRWERRYLEAPGSRAP